MTAIRKRPPPRPEQLSTFTAAQANGHKVATWTVCPDCGGAGPVHTLAELDDGSTRCDRCGHRGRHG
jgi:hypothetical protein